MSDCQNCEAPSPGLNLCADCVDALAEALDQLPELIKQLQITVTRQDRLNLGVVGKSSENPSPVNWGAASVANDVEDLLIRWTDTLATANGVSLLPPRTVGPRFIGPLPGPQWRRLLPGYLGTPLQRARWLAEHLDLVARHIKAGEIFAEVTALTGDPDKPSQLGRLYRAIDKVTKLYAGPCPTVIARDQQGRAVECGEDLKADDGAAEVDCPKCKAAGRPFVIDVAKNRSSAIMSRDLMTETHLYEATKVLGEPVYSDDIQRWLAQGRLKESGFLSGSRITEKRQSARDARLFSLSRVRNLREADHQRRAAS